MARTSLVLTLHEQKAFEQMMDQAGATAGFYRDVGEDLLLAQEIVELHRKRRRAQYVHGMYMKTDAIIKSLKQRLERTQLRAPQAMKWLGNKRPPEFSDDPEVAVVLEVSLDTITSSARFAASWAEESFPHFEISTDIVLHEESFAVIEGAHFEPWSLQWRRIRLNAHKGSRCGDVRDPNLSPGNALIYLAAQHPERIRSIDNQSRLSYWIGGLRCTAPNGGKWRLTPRLSYFPDMKKVRLEAAWSGEASAQHCSPIFVS